ncbi:MAG: M10 family metallopeptidase [Sulfurimonas sp.]|nr:M10 family metallopeptidase [Sulfurimonas sp.]
MTTIEQKITGLYIAFYNRAPDKDGLQSWKQYASNLDESTALRVLAEGFSQHSKFADLYSDLDNQAFVEAIYSNSFANADNLNAIQEWSNLLDNGLSRSNMIADFVSSTLDNDAIDIDAIQKQDLLTNKVTVALEFVSKLSNFTNFDFSTDQHSPASLDGDAAYQASITILQNITEDLSSVTTLRGALDLLQNNNNAISILNSLISIDIQSIIEAISSNSNQIFQELVQDRSNINNALGELSDFDTAGVSSLISGEFWDSGANITYSFNDTIPSSYYEYGSSQYLIAGWKPLNTAQKNAVREITNELNKFIDTPIQEVSSGGLIQYNVVQIDSLSAGFAFYPDSYYEVAGDIFLSNSFNTLSDEYELVAGGFGWSTIAHELGHALGLKHPFEGASILQNAQDNISHTVMSYTDVNNTIAEFTFSLDALNVQYLKLQPNLYSLFDVAALQAIYGANSNTNSSNDIYTLQYSDFKIQTIWDSGGEDTINLSQTLGDSTIDLSAGTLNSADEHSLSSIIENFQEEISNSNYDSWVAEVVTELYDNNQLYTGLNNLAIATGSVIENIISGSGDDIITDNEVDNSIITSLGDDTIYLGNGGYDYVDGGGGSDTIYIDSVLEEVEIEKTSLNQYTILADDFSVEFVNIEFVYFTDTQYIL